MSKLAWAFLITDGSGDDPTPPVDLEEETIAYLTAGDEELDTPFAEAVNDYVLALKAADAWDTDDLHYIFCAPTKTQAKVNLMNPGVGDLTEVGTIGINAYQGVTTPALESYLLLEDVDSYIVHRTSSSAAYGAYLYNEITESGVSVEMSTDSAELLLSKYMDENSLYGSIDGGTRTYGISSFGDTTIVDPRGYFILQVSDATSNPIGYQNGSVMPEGSGERTNQPTVGDLKLLGGHATPYASLRTISLFHYGGHLTSGQIVARTAAIEQLLTDLQEI